MTCNLTSSQEHYVVFILVILSAYGSLRRTGPFLVREQLMRDAAIERMSLSIHKRTAAPIALRVLVQDAAGLLRTYPRSSRCKQDRLPFRVLASHFRLPLNANLSSSIHINKPWPSFLNTNPPISGLALPR